MRPSDVYLLGKIHFKMCPILLNFYSHFLNFSLSLSLKKHVMHSFRIHSKRWTKLLYNFHFQFQNFSTSEEECDAKDTFCLKRWQNCFNFQLCLKNLSKVRGNIPLRLHLKHMKRRKRNVRLQCNLSIKGHSDWWRKFLQFHRRMFSCDAYLLW